MKNLGKLLAAVILLFAFQSKAQWTTNGNHIRNTNSDYVGIGVTTPGYILDVQRNMTEPKISISNTGGAGGAAFRLFDQASNTDWRFKAAATGSFKIRDNIGGFDVLVFEKYAANNSIYVKNGGNVGIGTSTPSSKLAVNGKINCKEVEVTLTGWSDFVFDDNYQLKPLKELESFINENGHLPGVPTEEVVIRDGVKLGEMNAILLEKIEELTLYVIELNREIESLKKQNNGQK